MPRGSFPRAAKPAPAGKAGGNGKRKKDDSDGEAERPPPKKKTRTEIPQILDEERLAADLNVDYSKKRKKRGQQIQMPKKQQWTRVKDIITEREDAPKGWNPEEPDLMKDDFHAQIDRCLERISLNIMPHVYQVKMKEFLEKQVERDELMAAEPGLSWPVVQRLDELKFILNWLVAENDVHKMVDTVNALIAQYRSGELDYTPDLVTYWHAGVQLCLPRPFHWDEYSYIHDRCQGHEGFWVEGFLGRAPGMSKLSMISKGDPLQNYTTVRFTLRIPHGPVVAEKQGDKGKAGKNGKNGKNGKDHQPQPRPPSFEFDFMDDTGSTLLSVFEEDINLLRGLGAHGGQTYPLPRCLGVAAPYTADGRRVPSLFRQLEINMWSTDDSAYMSSRWDAIPASIWPGRATGPGFDRLGGAWLRHRFYTGTCPDQSLNLHVFDYNPGMPQGQRTLPTATSAQLAAPIRTPGLQPVSDFPHLDPNMASGHSLI